MKFLLLLCIKIYWNFWEEKERHHCIFRQSCSKYVYKIAKEKGGIAGLRALKNRFFKCRPGYTVFSQKGDIFVQLVDGSIIKEEMASSNIVALHKKPVTERENSLNS